MLFKNLNYILREIYDILSEDALNYPVINAASILELNNLAKNTASNGR